MEKRNVLFYSHDPRYYSGYAQVVEGIASHILSDWNIDFACINHSQTYKTPDTLSECNFIDVSEFGNKYGQKFICQWIRANPKYNLVFCLEDIFLFSDNLGERKFIEVLNYSVNEIGAELLLYLPLDCNPRPEWILPILQTTYNVVVPTKWAKKQIQKTVREECVMFNIEDNVDVIPHGVDFDDFHPVYSDDKKKQFRTDGLDGNEDDFVVGYVGANQPRKRIPVDVMVPFAKFHKENPDTKLVLHTDPVSDIGWDLYKVKESVVRDFKINPNSIQFLTESGDRVSTEFLNYFYNMIDIFYLPSMEGWGLPVTEAMATKTLTVVGDHAGLSEVGGDGRSFKVGVNDTTYCPYGDTGVLRSSVDGDSVVKTFDLLKNKLSEQPKNISINNAYSFCEDIEMEKVSMQWSNLFFDLILNI